MPSLTAVVATLGTSPAVVTRALDHLLCSSPPVSLREVVVLHTGGPEIHRGIAKLLTSFPGVRPDAIDGIRSFPKAKYAGLGQAEFGLLLDGMEVPDMLQPDDNKRMFAALCRHIWRLRRAGCEVIVSLAGGRKQQSAYALLAAMLFGAKRAIHVIPRVEPDPERDQLHVPLDRFHVVNIPFPSLVAAQGDLSKSDPPAKDLDLINLIDGLCASVPPLLDLGRAEANFGESAGDVRLPGVIASSAAMRKAVNVAMIHAATGTPLHIHGVSGSGRRHLARALHDSGFRERFCSIDAGDRLFQHLLDDGPKSFLRRVAQDAGHVTLFIGQFDRLDKKVQDRLLPLFGRLPELVLQDSDEPDTKSGPTRVHLICSSSGMLRDRISDGSLLSDWSKVFPINQDVHMPPMAQRIEDLPTLVPELLKANAARYKYGIPEIPPGLIEALCGLTWGSLQASDLALALHAWTQKKGGDWRGVLANLESSRRDPAWDSLEVAERRILEAWFEIRRNPDRAASIRDENSLLFEKVVNYARDHFLRHREEYRGEKSVDAFCERFFKGLNGKPQKPAARRKKR